MRRLRVHYAFVLALLPARAVHADVARVEFVVLKNGSSYQGELVEKIVGDHVTIKLATGALMRLAWADVASSQTSGSSGHPLGQPVGSVEVDHRDASPPAIMESPETRELLAAAESQELVPRATWPRPDRTPAPFEGRKFFVAVGSGFNTRDGYVTAALGYEPFSWLGLELGAGYGGAFGPTFHDEARIGLPIGRVRLMLGLGGTFSFLVRGSNPTQAYVGAPTVGEFFDVLGCVDIRLFRGLTLRAKAGPSFLANAGSYGALCPLHAADCVQYEGARPSPWSIGALESDGKSAPVFVTGHLDLGWAF